MFRIYKRKITTQQTIVDLGHRNSAQQIKLKGRSLPSIKTILYKQNYNVSPLNLPNEHF